MLRDKPTTGRWEGLGMPPGCRPTSAAPLSSPDEVAAEDEAEHEDKDARAENDHVDVQWQVLERDGRHRAGFTGINQPQTAGAPFWGGGRGREKSVFRMEEGQKEVKKMCCERGESLG